MMLLFFQSCGMSCFLGFLSTLSSLDIFLFYCQEYFFYLFGDRLYSTH